MEETTLQYVGAFPIPRNAYAKMVDQLRRDGARLLVFDVNFPLPEKNSAVDALKKLERSIEGQANAAVVQKIREIEATSDNDKLLAKSLKDAGNVILGHLFLDDERAKSVDAAGAQEYFATLSAHPFPQVISIGAVSPAQVWKQITAEANEYSDLNASGIYANLDILAASARSFGFFNETPDSDGTFRRTPLLVSYKYGNYDEQFYPSLDLEAVRQYQNIQWENIVAYIAENGIDHIELGSHNLRTSRDGTVLVNYAGPYRTYKHYPMVDVVDGRFAPGTFKNKLVVFGATAVAVGDTRTTPFHDADYMGVEIHANVIDNILHSAEPGRGFITRGYKEEAIDLLFILTFGLGLGYWFSRTKPLTENVGLFAAFCIVAAIMGFWGSPFPQNDHALRACACALDMRTRLQQLNMKWDAEGRKQLAIGVGINTGEVNVGNMGSSKRFSWTVMGDNVNLASRLEGITKEYHVQCVVSEATYRAAKEQYVFREIDRIKVKGKTVPMPIYELLDWTRNESFYTERIVRFSEALTAYRRQEWHEAIDLFSKIKAKFHDDGHAET